MAVTEETGKYVSISPIDPDLHNPFAADNKEWVARADALFKKVVDETTLFDQSNGIFTYFVYQNKHVYGFDDRHGDPEAVHIGCIKVRSGLEFGTTHMNLADYLGLYMDPGSERKTAMLLFAGEFKKTDASITYNFQSGTFIAAHNTLLSPEELADIRRKRCEIMETLLTKYGLVGTFTEEPFIKLGVPRFTMDERKDIERLGLKLKEFDTKRECDESDLLGDSGNEDNND